MRRALDAFIVEGIETSVPLSQRILAEPDFISGNLSTRFMERFNRTAGDAKNEAHQAAQSAVE